MSDSDVAHFLVVSRKPKQVVCFTTYCKLISVRKRRFNGDCLLFKAKIINTDLVCRSFLNISEVFLYGHVGNVDCSCSALRLGSPAGRLVVGR